MKTQEQLKAQYAKELAADPDAWENYEHFSFLADRWLPFAPWSRVSDEGQSRRRADAPPPKQSPMRHEIDPFFTEAHKEFADKPAEATCNWIPSEDDATPDAWRKTVPINNDEPRRAK